MENVDKAKTKSPVQSPLEEGRHEPKDAKKGGDVKHLKSEKAADVSKTSDGSKMDQKQGTAIGQNPKAPDRMVS